MKHEDLTILYYTANKNKKCFMKNTQKNLLEAVGDTKIVSVSFEPTIIGENCTNIVIGKGERSAYKLYQQILIAAKEAETEFVATAEDDMLYHSSHFDYRPKLDKLAYNMNKWSIFGWVNPPILSFRSRMLMNSLICRRGLLIKTLEERYQKYHTYEKKEFEKIRHYWGEPGRFENRLDIPRVETEEYKSKYPNIMFSTKEALGYKDLGSRKAHSDIRQDSVEPWGTSEEILSIYKKTI